MVDGLDPCHEQPVQLLQILDPPAVADLDQELTSNGLEESFDFPFAFGPVGGGVDDPDAQLRRGAFERVVDKRGAVVDMDGLWDAAGGQAPTQRGGEPHDVLEQAPPGAHHGAGVVVEEAEQVGLPAGDLGAMEGIANPANVGGFGFEPAERLGWLPVRAGAQFEAVEMAQQGAFRR